MKNFLKKHGQTPPRTSRLVESSGVILSKDVMKFRKKLQAQRDIKTKYNFNSKNMFYTNYSIFLPLNQCSSSQLNLKTIFFISPYYALIVTNSIISLL